MKNIILASVGIAVASYTQFAQAITFGGDKVQQWVQGTNESADQAVQTLLSRAITFLYIVAVVYGLWGGFNILTAAGDEDKVKKGRTIIIQALIGLIVIFLASSIVNWLVRLVLQTN